MEERSKLLGILAIVSVITIITASTLATLISMNSVKETFFEKSGLNVKIIADKMEGTVPLRVNFSSIVTNSIGKVRYKWDFGNGKTSSEREPSTTYGSNGTFTCSLTVIDDAGRKATDSIRIISRKNRPPIVTISINHNTVERDFIPLITYIVPYAGNQQQLIDFLGKRNPYILGDGKVECFAQVNDPEGDEIVSYRWKVQPEPAVTITGKTIYTTYEFNGSHIRIPDLYTWRTGRYVVTLTVEDSYGNTANATIEFQVEKNTKETMRQVRMRYLVSAFNMWNIYGVPLLGPILVAGILSIWKYHNFTAIKLLGLLLFKYLFGLDIDDEVLTKQVQTFFQEYPSIKNFTKVQLFKILNKLEEKKNSTTDPAKREEIQRRIDSIYTIMENLGMVNCRPVISDPYPEDGQRYVDVNYPKVYVNISDKEGDKFDVYIYGRYLVNATLLNQSSGIFNAALITPLPRNTEIEWHVKVIDDMNRTVERTFRFTTFYE